MNIIEPAPGPHYCPTPGSMKPQSDWVRARIPAFSDGEIRMPTMYAIGTLWQCECGRWWHCCDRPDDRLGGYQGGGRIWKPLRWWNFDLREQVRNFERHSTGTEVTSP